MFPCVFLLFDGIFKVYLLTLELSPKKWDTDSTLGFPRELIIHPLISTMRYHLFFFLLLICDHPLWGTEVHSAFDFILIFRSQSHSTKDAPCSETFWNCTYINVFDHFCISHHKSSVVLRPWYMVLNTCTHKLPPSLGPWGGVSICYVKWLIDCHSVCEKIRLRDHQFFHENYRPVCMAESISTL